MTVYNLQNTFALISLNFSLTRIPEYLEDISFSTHSSEESSEEQVP